MFSLKKIIKDIGHVKGRKDENGRRYIDIDVKGRHVSIRLRNLLLVAYAGWIAFCLHITQYFMWEIPNPNRNNEITDPIPYFG